MSEDERIRLTLSGWREQQICRLARLRDRYRRGELTEEDMGTKRLLFMRWLAGQGRIAG